MRDWLYVEDHCKAIDLVVRCSRIGEIYNIGGHNEMRNIDIVKLIIEALGKMTGLYFLSSRCECQSKPGETISSRRA